MSLNKTLYKNRLDAYKIGSKESKVDYIKHQILYDFFKNPSYFNVEINGEFRDVHIINDTQGRSKLLCKPGEIIKAGSYIKWRDKIYLCTYIENDTSIQYKATIQPCNHKIKWLNDEGKLIERMCIASAKTLYTTGIREEKLIDIPDGMVGIQIPYDDATKELERDMGFIFNKTKYNITFYNDVEYDGLIILICSESGIDRSVDDVENKIANRWIDGIDRLVNDESEEPEEPAGAYIIEGNDSIYWNETKTYTVKKFNNGTEVESMFDFTLSNGYAEIISHTENTVSIKAKSGIQYQYVTLIATDIDNGEFVEKQILIKGLI